MQRDSRITQNSTISRMTVTSKICIETFTYNAVSVRRQWLNETERRPRRIVIIIRTMIVLRKRRRISKSENVFINVTSSMIIMTNDIARQTFRLLLLLRVAAATPNVAVVWRINLAVVALKRIRRSLEIETKQKKWILDVQKRVRNRTPPIVEILKNVN